MCNQINKILCLILFQFVILVGASNTKVIKSYSISKNFGTETRELSQSTVVRYNSKNQLLDSTLYIYITYLYLKNTATLTLKTGGLFKN